MRPVRIRLKKDAWIPSFGRCPMGKELSFDIREVGQPGETVFRRITVSGEVVTLTLPDDGYELLPRAADTRARCACGWILPLDIQTTDVTLGRSPQITFLCPECRTSKTVDLPGVHRS